jgi:hypothetical protein
MIDVVIPLGKGSTWENNELRYSLRSIEKHLKNYRNIYIVGECPNWIQNVIHIPFTETGHPSRNIMEKVKAACEHDDITKLFLFTNDDIFFLKDQDAVTYPFYHRGGLQEAVPKNKGNWYQEYVLETIAVLHDRNLGAWNYDLHCPIRYNKYTFREVMAQYDWNKKLVVKSIYCSTLGIEGEYMDDCKIAGRMAEWHLRKKIEGRHVFSIGDRCLLPFGKEQESSVKKLLNELYPNPSKYERNAGTEK